MKKLALLGSTGSIGTQALDVVRCIQKEGEHAVKVEALAAHSNIRLLEEQIREFKPQAVAVFDLEAASKLRAAVRDLNVKVYSGMEGLCALTELESVDIVLNSVVGMVGLKPTLTALEAKKQMALANKETLVAGGSLVMKTAKENGIEILPVDSEHSAIFQCLQGMYKKCDLNKIILTASGGPFFGKKAGELQHIRPADALKHPNWDMGAKVTIDSSTLMNKGLEFIEAKWLFDMEPDDIDVVVHRESIVHSLIEYKDHSVIAQLGVPDMRIPIQYALTYPRRFPSPVKQLNLADWQKLTFYAPDEETFTCFGACKRAIRRGGTLPAAVNGANEAAVALFLKEKQGGAEHKGVSVNCMPVGYFKKDAGLKLAMSFANEKKKTLLIDLVKEPEGKEAGNSISRYVLGDESRPVPTTQNSYLDVLCRDVAEEKNFDVVMNERFASYVKEMQDTYEYIVINSPNVAESADAFAAGKLCDKNFVVCARGGVNNGTLYRLKNEAAVQGIVLEGVLVYEL